MKVLHVIETLARGGAERYLVTLLPELKRQGLSPAVGVLRPPIKLQAELERAGIPVTVFPERHKWSLLQNAQDIADAAQKQGADVIHAHLYFPMVATSLARITGKTNAKTCVTFHNLAYSGANRSSLRLVAKRNLARAVLPRGITSFFAVSDAVARHYENALGIKDVSVQYNPIDLSFVASFGTEKQASDGTFRIVLPGRLVHEKGHLDLIAAAKELSASERANLSILFSGDGPMRETLEAEIQANGLGDLIKILGELKHPEFLSTMANADIVAVPSRFEGFGLVALEAMALGKPIVATDVGGLPEVLGDVGLLVPSANPTALVGALRTLIEDPNLRQELGDKAKKRAFQGFDVQSAASALISTYKDMLDPSAP